MLKFTTIDFFTWCKNIIKDFTETHDVKATLEYSPQSLPIAKLPQSSLQYVCIALNQGYMQLSMSAKPKNGKTEEKTTKVWPIKMQ